MAHIGGDAFARQMIPDHALAVLNGVRFLQELASGAAFMALPVIKDVRDMTDAIHRRAMQQSERKIMILRSVRSFAQSAQLP